jgi:2-polyprenyl-6-methoxyphenol hydroxylase-like FAD-dependent oxidoreductase
MHDIGIVGTGIAGLHLALYLQQRGLRPTLYAEQRPEEMRTARLPSTPAIFGTVRRHMKELGIAHWETPDTSIHAFDFGIKGMPQFSFHVPFRPPAQFIDMRVYLPRLLEDFAARGGTVVTGGALDAEAVTRLGERHDLVVVASGRGGLAGMFPCVPERSLHATPQRRLLGGLFRGIRFPDEFCFTQRIVAGAGEVCEFQMLTHDGPVAALLIFAVPGGPLEGITQLRHEDAPAAFDRAVYDFLGEHAPEICVRIADPAAFGALGPRDLYQGSIIPVVRHGVAELRPGRHALALGDAHVTMDPLTAQGANAAGKAAWRLGGLLMARVAEGAAFDGAFCARTEHDLWEMLQPFAEWNNAALGPPPPHVFGLIAAAAQNPAIAMEFTANFDDPRRQWEILRSPENTAAFIHR